MNQAEMKEYIAKLEAEKAALQAKLAEKSSATFSLKVSDLGALSIYGLQRFPVTLYVPQVNVLLSKVEAIKAFIEANKDKFSTGKDDPRFLAVRAKRAEEKAAKETGVSEVK